MGMALGRSDNDNEEDERVPPIPAEWLPVRCSSGVCIQYQLVNILEECNTFLTSEIIFTCFFTHI